MTESQSFLAAEFIRQKRDKEALDLADIKTFVDGIPGGATAPEQIAAFAMAVFLNGMSNDEKVALTTAMRDSGDTMDWLSLGFEAGAPIVDKHSTGGVGDKVSLMLAPIVAAAGAYVPMISGRGLGHTGGTLDKLQAIPGYDPYPDNQRFADIVKTVGCSIIGQTGRLAPADKIFYGVRDVTGTVESVPLITASILSKKLAAGLNALSMDVKCGTGAFMDTPEKAIELAQSIVDVASAAGVPTTALVTDMNAVLGRTAGNAVEVWEAIDFLVDPGSADPRLRDVTLALAAEMVHMAGVTSTLEEAAALTYEKLSGGSAAAVFEKMVAAQGGPTDILQSYFDHLVLGSVERVVTADRSGIIATIEPRQIGLAVIGLGGGRRRADDQIDLSVGFTDIAANGTRVNAGDPIARIYAADTAAADAAENALISATEISDQTADGLPVILKKVTASQ